MPVSPPFSIWSNLFTCPQASGNFRHAEVSLDGLFASPSKIWCDHPAAPPSLDWLIHLSYEHGVAPLPLLRTWSGLPGLPDPSSSPAAANEDRLLLLPVPSTLTTLPSLLYYFTTHSYYLPSLLLRLRHRLLLHFYFYSYYATFTTLLPYYFTPTTDSYYLRSFPWLLRGWTVGGVLVMPVMDASGVVRRGFELWASWVSSLLPVGSTPGVTPSELGWMD